MPALIGVPSERELREAAVPFALPLRREFRGITVREGVLLRGPSGWGEFAPFADYDDSAAARWLAAALEASHGSWPLGSCDSVAVNAIIPAVGADDAAVLAREAVLERGCTTVKVKVATTLAADEARVAAVRDALDTALGRGRGMIRLDANGGWDAGAAAAALRRLEAYGIEYVEQPCGTLDEMRELRSSCAVPIAVDEAVRRAPDPLDPALASRVRECADVVILKAMPLGGVRRALHVADAMGLPAVASGSLDSSVGLASGIALAAALGDERASGLGTGSLLAADLVDHPVVPVGGRLSVQRIAPDLARLVEARDLLGDERAAWWFARLERARAILAHGSMAP